MGENRNQYRIYVSEETAERLAARRRLRQTYNTVILELLDMVEKNMEQGKITKWVATKKLGPAADRRIKG